VRGRATERSGARPGALPDDVATYPFPLPHGTYRISANVEEAGVERATEAGSWGATMLHVGADHGAVVGQRRAILDARMDGTRSGRFVAAPHARAASWDALLWLLGRKAREDPEAHLERDGAHHRWTDARLGVDQEFVLGDDASLPEHPLAFAGRQVEEDVVVLGARDDRLWLDAGLVVHASVWSIGFDAGMSFGQLHRPVPGEDARRVFTTAERFLLRLHPGEAYRRLNWGLQLDDRPDLSLDAFGSWGARRAALDVVDPGREVHLRTEVQHLVKLPLTGSVLFLIGVRLLPLERVALVPAWAARLASVLETLAPDTSAYKELESLGPVAAAWLRAHAPT
jgi:dimethylamine monooxygenase subunit A